MKKLLVGINTKFIHSNLAIRSIKEYGRHQGVEITTAEYTINQSTDYILDEIVMRSPDILGISCYLWNIEYVIKIIKMFKKILPKTVIILGGPEVSYDSVEWLENVSEIDYIVSGEGEHSTNVLLKAIDKGQIEPSTLYGVTYRDGDQIIKNPQGEPLDMALVPFVYDDRLEGLDHRIIYYETSRGCPFNCQYCLSSIEKGVRFRPIELVYEELQFFLDQKVMQVKFVDRTFNARKRHAMAIWTYLRENDNGYTNFHFEMTADLIDDEMSLFLKTLRVGLVQFEVGVQSTNEATIVDVERKSDFELLKKRVIEIKAGKNIHLHLDLIAGLPKEDYQTFSKSFNDVMAIRPEQLQLGFLKVLKGSKMHKKRAIYDIIYREFPPYEVLSTKELSYVDLRNLKHIESLLDQYYNSGQFVASCEYMMGVHDSPFAFYEGFSKFWEEQGLFHLKHNRMRLFDALYQYSSTTSVVNHQLLGDLLIHDLSSKEKPKKWPDFYVRNETLSNMAKDFYKNEDNKSSYFKGYENQNTRQIQRITHIESYKYDIIAWLNTGEIHPINKGEYVYYDYKSKDLLTDICLPLSITL